MPLFNSINSQFTQPAPGFQPIGSGAPAVPSTTPATAPNPYVGSHGRQFDPNSTGYNMLRAMAAAHGGGTLPQNWYPGYYRDLAAAGTPPPTAPAAPTPKPPVLGHDTVTNTAVPPTPAAPQGNIMQSIMQAFSNGGGTAVPGQGFDLSRLMAMIGNGG